MRAKLLRSIETSTRYPELRAIAIPAGEIFETVLEPITPYGPGMLPVNPVYRNIESPFPEAFILNNPETFEVIDDRADELSKAAKELLKTLENVYDLIQSIRRGFEESGAKALEIANTLKSSVE